MINEPENWQEHNDENDTDYAPVSSEQENDSLAEDDFGDNFIKAEALGADEVADGLQKSGGWLKEFYEWTQAIALAVVLALFINQFLFAIVQVEGSSMVPTLHDKERLIVTKLFYKPQPKDIVIIKSSVLKKHIVKRVIALPGQVVDINSATGDVYVDGVLQDEPYIKEKISSARVGTKYQYPYTVPENTVFVMGDNRNNSQDSRSIGVIPYKEIVGKASFRIMPFNKIGGLYHNLSQSSADGQ